MKSAASTFAAIREAGSPADNATSQVIHAVIGALKTTLVLFEHGENRLCFLISSFPVHFRIMNAACRALLAKERGLVPGWWPPVPTTTLSR